MNGVADVVAVICRKSRAVFHGFASYTNRPNDRLFDLAHAVIPAHGVIHDIACSMKASRGCRHAPA
jgi:hypothetical protein